MSGVEEKKGKGKGRGNGEPVAWTFYSGSPVSRLCLIMIKR